MMRAVLGVGVSTNCVKSFRARWSCAEPLCNLGLIIAAGIPFFDYCIIHKVSCLNLRRRKAFIYLVEHAKAPIRYFTCELLPENVAKLMQRIDYRF